jgi:hypothetical protein
MFPKALKLSEIKPGALLWWSPTDADDCLVRVLKIGAKRVMIAPASGPGRWVTLKRLMRLRFEDLHGRTLLNLDGKCWLQARISAKGDQVVAIDSGDGHQAFWGVDDSWQRFALRGLEDGTLVLVPELPSIAREIPEPELSIF